MLLLRRQKYVIRNLGLLLTTNNFFKKKQKSQKHIFLEKEMEIFLQNNLTEKDGKHIITI